MLLILLSVLFSAMVSHLLSIGIDGVMCPYMLRRKDVTLERGECCTA